MFTGLRPGEKLYEELYFNDEEMQATPHPKLFVAYHRPYSLPEVQRAIAEVAALVHGSPELLRLKIKELVAEYAESGVTTPRAAETEAAARLPQRTTNQPTPVAET